VIDYAAIAKEYGYEGELTDAVKAEIDTILSPNYTLDLYLFALIKVLGTNNNIVFTLPEVLPLPKDGMVGFMFNTIGGVATITAVEGREALEAIEHADNRDTEAEPADVREVRDGEDAHRADVSEPSTD